MEVKSKDKYFSLRYLIFQVLFEFEIILFYLFQKGNKFINHNFVFLLKEPEWNLKCFAFKENKMDFEFQLKIIDVKYIFANESFLMINVSIYLLIEQLNEYLYHIM